MVMVVMMIMVMLMLVMMMVSEMIVMLVLVIMVMLMMAMMKYSRWFQSGRDLDDHIFQLPPLSDTGTVTMEQFMLSFILKIWFMSP